MKLENVELIIESGQFFRYHKTDYGYFIQTRNKVFFLSFDGSFRGISENEIKDFFQLDITPEEKHIRVIKQDPWECLISFVCSAASNIPRIRKNLNSLSKEFGNKIVFQNSEFYTFPEPGKMNDLEKIKQCGVGFRAKYIYEINKIVDEAWLKELESLQYEEAKKKLMTLPGIGEKVADCVCLYSLKHHQSFPIDVWIKRVLEKYKMEGSYSQLSKQAMEKFGPFAGWVQQYLYNEIRNQ